MTYSLFSFLVEMNSKSNTIEVPIMKNNIPSLNSELLK